MNSIKTIKLSDYASYLTPRTKNWHKGMSGHVLVVGGGPGFSGAPRLAAEAALRVGAGLVSVATHPDYALNANTLHPEIISHAVSDQASLNHLLKRCDVLVVGPGLTQTTWGMVMWEAVAHVTCPMVVDADALNLLARHPRKQTNWILTPHPGEAARLLSITSDVIQHERNKTVQAIQSQYGGVAVLKGAGTLIQTDDGDTLICDKGNPGMASAGMGDVLSGVIGGLLAQGMPLKVAAALGVYLHAAAGDMAANAGERGTIATDLMPYLRQLVNLDGHQHEK